MATPGIVKNVLLTITSVALALAVAEISLRGLGYRYSPMAIEDASGRDDRLVHLFTPENFVTDPALLWRPRANFSVFNAQGFRGHELSVPKASGQFRIFAIGDSNTLGWAGEDGTHWPGFLEGVLAEARPELVVINAGVWGYSSHQGLQRFLEVLDYDPDLVLISFGSNDAHYVDVPDERFAASLFRDGPTASVLNRLRLGQLLVALSDRSRGVGDGELEPRVDLARYRDNLRRMADTAGERGIRTIFLTRPFIGTTTHPLWWKNRGPLYNAATLEVAIEAGAPVIDLYSLFKDQEQYFADESHFTPEGHRRAAELIGERIKPFVFAG